MLPLAECSHTDTHSSTHTRERQLIIIIIITGAYSLEDADVGGETSTEISNEDTVVHSLVEGLPVANGGHCITHPNQDTLGGG